MHSGDNNEFPQLILALAHKMYSPPRLLVDKCTPRDKYARTYVPLSVSLCPSADDTLVTAQVLSPSVARRRAHSSSDSQGWKLLPTPIRPSFRPRDYELPTCAEDEDRSDTHTISLKVLRRSLKNVEFDPSCLDCLDQQTLLSPTESFSEVCYTEATHEQAPVPILQPLQPRIRKRTAYYDRTAMSEEDPYHDWDENMSVRWERPSRKQIPPVPPLPEHLKKPKEVEPRPSYQQSVLADLETRLLRVSTNPGDSVHYFPVPSQRRSEESGTTSLESPSSIFSTSSKSPSTKSGGTFQRLSNALSRSRVKSRT